jgi:hypothetical protein
MIPNLAGIKYTHEDFMDFLSCLHFNNGKYDMLWGATKTCYRHWCWGRVAVLEVRLIMPHHFIIG